LVTAQHGALLFGNRELHFHYKSIVTHFEPITRDKIRVLSGIKIPLRPQKSREIAVEPGWICAENRAGIMDYFTKYGLPLRAFDRKWVKIVESFEAGNTKVFKVFPINFNSGGAVSN